MDIRRLRRFWVVVILATVAFLFAPPVPAHAAGCSGSVAQDFDGDDHADVVVARTLPGTSAGVVDIIMSGGTSQTISAGTLGYTSAAGDQFGAAVVVAGIDELDNCPDLVIGSPGTAGGGAVYLVRGSGSGVESSAIRLLSPAVGARFGATVGVTDLSLTRVKLLVGAPGLTVGPAAQAGAVLVWQLTGGVPGASPTTFTYNTFGAAPAAGDHLGSVMDVASWRVTLGVPDRDLGSAPDAGEVITFDFVDEFGAIQVRDWTRANQGRPGAPGVPEAGDHFGASVDAGGAVIVVGVPGEDVGAHKDAGAVMHYVEMGDNTTASWVSWTQNSSGIPGGNESGDRWGAAVHLAWIEVLVDDDPFPRQVYVVGAPGEDVGSVRNAGAITVIAPKVRPAFTLRQGSGLPGVAEKGDQVGAALGDFPGEYSGPYYGGDGILVGAPGEDVGTVVDAGVAVRARGLLPKGRFTWTTVRSVGTLVAGGRVGWTLPLGE